MARLGRAVRRLADVTSGAKHYRGARLDGGRVAVGDLLSGPPLLKLDVLEETAQRPCLERMRVRR